MKKIKYLLMIIAVSMLVTGCVKFNATMEIKKDKSMEFSVVYAFDKTIFGEGNGLKEEDVKDAEKQGFTIKKYSEGNYEGFTLTKKINNIDEVSTDKDVIYSLSGLTEESVDNKYIFKVVKGNEKNTYYAKLKFDSNDSGMNSTGGFDDEDWDDEETLPDETEEENPLTTGSGNSLDDLDLSGMTAGMDLSFKVILPHSAISSNATTKSSDGKELTWKLVTDKQEYIEFAFELGDNEGGFNMLYVGIGAAVLVLGIVLVLIMSKKKNKSDSNSINSADNADTVEPELVSKQ